MWIPFLCLALGVAIGMSRCSSPLVRYMDGIIHAGLIILMLTLGAKIGSDSDLLSSLGLIGFRCTVIAAFAISGSVGFTWLLEKTLLPLKEVKKQLENINLSDKTEIVKEEEPGSSLLLWLMPACIFLGLLAGALIPGPWILWLDDGLMFSLIVLYVGVGLSFGTNQGVFRYLKILNWRILLISLTVVIGSLIGGAIAGLLLGMPIFISTGAAAGMTYYSLTGAVLTQLYGIEAGAYGFLVNVARELLTILFLPLLIRISPGSPIAAGASANMDVLLVPITKFVGTELGIVTLITGTVLTLVVPLLLSLLAYLGPAMFGSL